METDVKLEDLEEEPEAKLIDGLVAQRYDRERKRSAVIGHFLGGGEKVDAAVIEPRYYGELLAWALHRYIEVEGWEVVKTVGYRSPQPVYINVNTGCGECQNVLRDGSLFVKKGSDRFAITIDANLRGYNSVVVTGPARRKKQVHEFANGVHNLAKEQNFYRGEKLELGRRIRFLNLSDRTWESLVLDTGLKDEIWANTIGFLANRERLASYGIPAKRGVLLVGEPGTGKTLVCKALMAKSPGTTCIMANTYALDADEYITELYELAQDLSPSIVFIEDIDLIAQNRMEWGYTRGPALLSLLSVLDGVEEHSEIITVATTNCLEVLDKAIGQRPSRFDRVIELSRPSLEQRKVLITALCQKIPLDEDVQAHVARKTENLTPAQLKEVIYSLVIGNGQSNCSGKSGYLRFSVEEVNSAISKIGRTNKRHLGFAIRDNHFGELSRAATVIQREIETDVR